jgi:hypothetical protein
MVQICAAQLLEAGQLNPTKAEPSKSLPQGYTRSYVGFLIKDLQREVKVDQEIVSQETAYLQAFGVIAGIIGRRPPTSQF